MRASEIFPRFREHLKARGIQTGFDIQYPHKVELLGWTREAMGAEQFDQIFLAARSWAQQLGRSFSSSRMRDGLKDVGHRFEFERVEDAVAFELRWG